MSLTFKDLRLILDCIAEMHPEVLDKPVEIHFDTGCFREISGVAVNPHTSRVVISEGKDHKMWIKKYCDANEFRYSYKIIDEKIHCITVGLVINGTLISTGSKLNSKTIETTIEKAEQLAAYYGLCKFLKSHGF